MEERAIKTRKIESASKPSLYSSAIVGEWGAASADRRPLAINLIAAVALIFFLQWAREVLIPLVLAVFLNYLLDPVVAWMARRKIPRALGSALLLITIVAGVGSLIYTLRHQGEGILEELPAAAQKFRQSLQEGRNDPDGTLNKVQKAAREIEKAAAEASNSAPAPRPNKEPISAPVTRPLLNIHDYIWVGTLGIVGATLQSIMVLFLVYFMLISGDSFRRKLVKIAGPSLGQKRITLEVLDKIEVQIKRFLLVQLYTSIMMGLATWLAFWWIGLDNAGMWGIAAGILKSIPFMGGVVIIGGASLVGYLQFGTISMALLIGGVSTVLTGLDGLLVNTWMTSKAGQVNAVWVFVGILFWGWVWGVWGLLLGIPIIMVAKTICDHIEGLTSVGELLGE